MPHPEERALARVSKDATGNAKCSSSWFETAQERLLTMRLKKRERREKRENADQVR
jgi:hypothetical protein